MKTLPLLLAACLAAASAGELTGRQVMEKVRSHNNPHDELTELEMRLVDDAGRSRTRKLRIEYLRTDEGLDRTLIRFSYPRRMKGTGLLTHEQKGRNDDQWLYLPSLRRTRRIAADAKTERFVQSDFTYEDLQPEDLEDNAYKLLRSETVDGRPCHVVEAVPRSPGGYSRREIAVDAERWLPLRILYFDEGGRHVKTEHATEVRQHEGRFWRPDRVEMADLEREHTTVFLIQRRVIDGGIDPQHFTLRFLATGR
ncbi:MAG: outer membrane lipoprotein-sorting protein [Candidatus Brocadiia bacterium]